MIECCQREEHNCGNTGTGWEQERTARVMGAGEIRLVEIRECTLSEQLRGAVARLRAGVGDSERKEIYVYG